MAPEKLEQLREWCEATADSYGISRDRWPAFVNEVAEKVLSRASRAEQATKEAERGMITHDGNNALLELATRFRHDGDWMVCVTCKHSQVASRIDEPFTHRDGCKHAESRHPWRELRDIIAPAAESRLSVERERVIQECAKVADENAQRARQRRDAEEGNSRHDHQNRHGWDMANAASHDIADAIRALSVKPEETTPLSEGHTS